MLYGSKPVDGGNLLLSSDERKDLLIKEPAAGDGYDPSWAQTSSYMVLSAGICG
jgi:hypothetical protein